MNSIFKKTILISCLALFLFGGVNFGIKNVYAQSANNVTVGDVATGAVSAINPVAGVVMNFWDLIFPDNTVASGVNTVASSTGVNPDTGIGYKGFIYSLIMLGNGILLQFIIIPILSLLFYLSSHILDTATIFTLSTTIFGNTADTASGAASGINTVWILIRNICNITFIFILLWTAIQTITGIASANTKKMIANVVIAALLINFSLFITRIIK